MKRPDLDNLMCVNPACQRFRLTGQDKRRVRKVYGRARLRLLRGRTCGEEFSERRGTALCNTKVTEAQAVSVIDHLGEGCGVRATARLVHVAKDTVARLLRGAGRQAERLHDQRVRHVPPRAVAFDEPWSFVKKSSSAAGWRRAPRPGPWGTIPPSRRRANCSCRSSWANGRKSRPRPWCTTPSRGSVRGICQRSSPMPRPVRRQPASPPLAVAIRPPPTTPEAGAGDRSCAGPKAWPMGRSSNTRKGVGLSA